MLREARSDLGHWADQELDRIPVAGAPAAALVLIEHQHPLHARVQMHRRARSQLDPVPNRIIADPRHAPSGMNRDAATGRVDHNKPRIRRVRQRNVIGDRFKIRRDKGGKQFTAACLLEV